MKKNALATTKPEANSSESAARLSVSLKTAQYGTPCPTIKVELSSVDFREYRKVNALLHRIAAEVELASDEVGAGWVVNISQERGTVSLELIEGDTAEANAGLAVLRTVTEQLERRQSRREERRNAIAASAPALYGK